MANNSSTPRTIIIVLLVIVIALAGYFVLTMPDQRSTTDKIGDAVHELPNGLDKASRQLEDRTPGQKIGDSIKDAGDKAGDTVKENTEGR